MYLSHSPRVTQVPPGELPVWMAGRLVPLGVDRVPDLPSAPALPLSVQTRTSQVLLSPRPQVRRQFHHA